jgi:hypothetical protein
VAVLGVGEHQMSELTNPNLGEVNGIAGEAGSVDLEGLYLEEGVVLDVQYLCRPALSLMGGEKECALGCGCQCLPSTFGH